MRKFYLITKNKELEEITGLTNTELWAAGVCLDDYDYFIVTQTSEKIRQSKTMDFELTPKDEIWGRLLTGCCSNEWTYVESPNGKFFVGGAYHS